MILFKIKILGHTHHIQSIMYYYYYYLYYWQYNILHYYIIIIILIIIIINYYYYYYYLKIIELRFVCFSLLPKRTEHCNIRHQKDETKHIYLSLYSIHPKLLHISAILFA